MTILCWRWLGQYPTGVGSLLYTSMVWTWHSLMSYPDTKWERCLASWIILHRKPDLLSHYSLPSCGTKADFKGSSVSNPITSDSLVWIVSFPMGQTAKWLRLCKILPCHLHVAFASHSFQDHLCKEKPTEFPSNQAEVFSSQPPLPKYLF